MIQSEKYLQNCEFLWFNLKSLFKQLKSNYFLIRGAQIELVRSIYRFEHFRSGAPLRALVE